MTSKYFGVSPVEQTKSEQRWKFTKKDLIKVSLKIFIWPSFYEPAFRYTGFREEEKEK